MQIHPLQNKTKNDESENEKLAHTPKIQVREAHEVDLAPIKVLNPPLVNSFTLVPRKSMRKNL